jgi:hypothetical protein
MHNRAHAVEIPTKCFISFLPSLTPVALVSAGLGGSSVRTANTINDNVVLILMIETLEGL